MRYVANPVEVDAFRIESMAEVGDLGIGPGKPVSLILDNGETVVADAGMTARMVPELGDYWVIQSDGYIYLNPKKVFERKYSPKPMEASA